MSEIVNSIWKTPAFLPYVQPALTPEAVANVEEFLGVRLPKSYLALLEQQNGGYIRYTLPDTPQERIWGIGPYYPNLLNDFWRPGPDGPEEGEWFPDDSDRLIPFDGDGHWHLAFDYRETGPTAEPRITYFDLETESERTVAPDFDAYLALLKEGCGPTTE